jgi:hypothetical protein
MPQLTHPVNAAFFGLVFKATLNPKLLGADLLIIENHRARAMLICSLAGGLGMSITIGIVGPAPFGQLFINSYSLMCVVPSRASCGSLHMRGGVDAEGVVVLRMVHHERALGLVEPLGQGLMVGLGRPRACARNFGAAGSRGFVPASAYTCSTKPRGGARLRARDMPHLSGRLVV